MIKVEIIGACHNDMQVQVENLQKEVTSEALQHAKQRVSGDGYVAASLFEALHMPYRFVSSVGSGIYGDYVQQQLQKQKIHVEGTTGGIGGSSFTLVDPQGMFVSLYTPGAEVEFDCELEHIDSSYLYMSQEMFKGQTRDALLNYVNSFEGTIFFEGNYEAFTEYADVLDLISNKKRMIHISELDFKYLFEQEMDAVDAIQAFYQTMQCPILLSLLDGGAMYCDGTAVMTVPFKQGNVVDRTFMAPIHGAAFVCAINAGVSLQSSIVFANTCSNLVGCNADSFLNSNMIEEMKLALKDVILQG